MPRHLNVSGGGNRGPLIPHPDRRNVWTREKAGSQEWIAHDRRWRRLETRSVGFRPTDDEIAGAVDGWVARGYGDVEAFSACVGGDWYLSMYGTPPEGDDTPSPGFFELVLTWVGIFLSGWLAFLVAHAAMQIALRSVGLQRSAVAAASLGAIVGAVTWLVGRRR